MYSVIRGLLVGVVAAGCHATTPRLKEAGTAWSRVACDSSKRLSGRRGGGPLTSAERESLLVEVQARRTAWRGRRISNYRVRVAVGCFCPWPQTPAILEVRDGIPVALRDTTGRPAGPLREPWSAYSVEGLFDALERAARRDDVVEVKFDPCFDYPTSIRGDINAGQVDDWYWVSADSLAPRR